MDSFGRKRRAVCGVLAASAGVAMLRPSLSRSEDRMLERAIPASGEMLPVIGMGTSDVFNVGASAAARAPLKDVMKVLVDSGGTLLDTSPMYGNAEGVAGDLARELGVRARMFLATKVWTRGRQEGVRQIESSMRLLRTDKLDLVQVHNLLDLDTQLATLRDLKERGRIRYVGITHYTVGAHADLADVMRREALDFVQLNYSIVTRDAEELLLPLAAERKVAVLVNRPFEDGAIFGRVRGKVLPAWAAEFDCASWGQFFLKFIVSHLAVTCAILATANPEHMRDNAAAGHGRMPDEKMRERMAEYVASL